MSEQTNNVSSFRTSYMWMDHGIPLEKFHIENEQISTIDQWKMMKDGTSLGQVVDPRFNKLLSRRSLKISPQPNDLDRQKMSRRLTDVSMSRLQFSPNIVTNSVNKPVKQISFTASSIALEEKFTPQIDRKKRSIWCERRDRTTTRACLLTCVLCVALVVVPIALVFGLPKQLTKITDTNIATLIQTTTTTTVPLMNVITQPNDTIVGLYNTTAGGSTGGSNGMYSTAAEYAPKAIDGSTSTKYLNYGSTGGLNIINYQAGLDTGFYLTPSISNNSVACSLLFATGNDAPERDPITITLEGSSATGTGALDLGSSWTLIYSGSTGIDPINIPGRSVLVSQQNFSNTIAYMSYRLLVTSKRSTSNSVQYSEVQIVGYY